MENKTPREIKISLTVVEYATVIAAMKSGARYVSDEHVTEQIDAVIANLEAQVVQS